MENEIDTTTLEHHFLADVNVTTIKYFEEKLQEKDDEIKSLQEKVRWFEEQFRLANAKKHGRSSEKLEVIQFDFFAEESEQEEDLVQQQEPETSFCICKNRDPRKYIKLLDVNGLRCNSSRRESLVGAAEKNPHIASR